MNQPQITFILFALTLTLSACQVRDPVPLRAGEETNKFLDQRNQKGGGSGAGNKLPDPTSVQHSLLAIERQSQMAHFLVLTDQLTAGLQLDSCLKVQSTKTEKMITHFVDLNNCRFDYDQTSQSQSGRFVITMQSNEIRIATMASPDSLRLKTTIRKAGRPTFLTEDILIEAQKIVRADSVQYEVKTFAISSEIESNSERSELHMNSSGMMNLESMEKGLTSNVQFVSWQTAERYHSNANNGTDWVLNLDMKDQDDLITETLSTCGSRKANLKLTYQYKPADSKALAQLTFKDNVIALEVEKTPIFIQAPDCTKSAKPAIGIWALPWGRVIQ